MCQNEARRYMLSIPLIDVVKKGDVEIFESHLSGDSRINAKDRQGYTALHYAAMRNNKSFAVLIEKKANPKEISNDGKRPLHLAARYGNEETAKLLIRNEAEIDAKDGWGRTAFVWCSDSRVADGNVASTCGNRCRGCRQRRQDRLIIRGLELS
jgi:ankyrin repeat protein